MDRRSASAMDALVAALRAQDVAAVRRLVDEAPALVHARDDAHGAQALYFAAACGNFDLMRLLLDRGADPADIGDYDGIGVIGWMTVHAPAVPMEALSLLLASGAGITCSRRSRWATPGWCARSSSRRRTRSNGGCRAGTTGRRRSTLPSSGTAPTSWGCSSSSAPISTPRTATDRRRSNSR